MLCSVYCWEEPCENVAHDRAQSCGNQQHHPKSRLPAAMSLLGRLGRVDVLECRTTGNESPERQRVQLRPDRAGRTRTRHVQARQALKWPRAWGAVLLVDPTLLEPISESPNS